MRLATTTEPEPAQPWRMLVLAALLFCAGVAAVDFIWIGFLGPDRTYDFFGLWSFARLLGAGPAAGAPAGIYRAATLQAFQDHLAPGFSGFFPCPYPPGFLVLTFWLGLLPLGAAKAVWTALGLAAMLAAAGGLLRGRFALALLAVAPAGILNAGTGETGFFVAALLLAGFAWLPARPLLAGVAFGLLSAKPQFLVLVPVALLARREGRAWLAAAVTALALAAVSCVAYGPRLWLDWAASLGGYQELVRQNQSQLSPLMTTVDGALLSLHASPGAAWAAQALAMGVAAGLVWVCFRRAAYPLAVAVLLVATPLAAPHGLIYDAPVLVAGMLLAGRTMALSGLEILVFLAAYLAPLGLAGPAAGLVMPVVPETLVLAIMARAALRHA